MFIVAPEISSQYQQMTFEPVPTKNLEPPDYFKCTENSYTPRKYPCIFKESFRSQGKTFNSIERFEVTAKNRGIFSVNIFFINTPILESYWEGPENILFRTVLFETPPFEVKAKRKSVFLYYLLCLLEICTYYVWISYTCFWN